MAGLNITFLGVGTCMFIAAATQTQWKAPRMLRPLLKIGQYSYEVYLTHMFVVFALLSLFLDAVKPMRLVPVLFVATILLAAVLGALVANLYSEPINRFLRNYSASGRRKMAPLLDSESIAPSEGQLET